MSSLSMKLRPLKYGVVYTGVATGLISLLGSGWWAWSGAIYVFGLIVLMEFFIPADTQNLSDMEEELVRKDPFYDWMVWAIVPVHYALLFLFLHQITQGGLTPLEFSGKVVAMGILTGALGINVAHELGHRKTKHEQTMAKMLLLTALYMHFFIEHNRGHHKNVSTPEDPASARRGEIVYFFWVRSVINSYLSAWRLEAQKLEKKGHKFFSIHNEMIWYQVIQVAFTLGIGLVFGWAAMGWFVVTAVMGFLLLETVNYIEHYGLQRRKPEGKDYYEPVKPIHSWNSNHVIGRLVLFELSRHSDHHFRASRPYQVLRHFDGAPQMPTGYPGMVLLSLVPPLWFLVMHRHIDKYRKANPEAALALA